MRIYGRTLVVARFEPGAAEDFGEYGVAEDGKTLVVLEGAEGALA